MGTQRIYHHLFIGFFIAALNLKSGMFSVIIILKDLFIDLTVSDNRRLETHNE